MSMMQRLKSLYWIYFSKPRSSRILYRTVRNLRATRIVEFGISDPERSLQLVQMAVGACPPEQQVCYTALDLFDARSDDQASLTIKQAHRYFGTSKAKVQLVPGPPAVGLARTANTLLGTDLVIFSADAVPAGNSKLWFYLPRLLHAQSCLFQAHQQDQDQQCAFGKISRAEVEQRAAASAPKRVA